VTQFVANMEVLDTRFDGCQPKAVYSIFKEGEPDHIDIELDDLSIEPGEELVFQLNEKKLATVTVKRNREAEFDNWRDEDIEFPKICDGDVLVITYKDVEVVKGVFAKV